MHIMFTLADFSKLSKTEWMVMDSQILANVTQNLPGGFDDFINFLPAMTTQIISSDTVPDIELVILSTIILII